MQFSLDVPKTSPLPPRLIIFGSAGIGKTTFGRQFPKPVMVCTEDGCPSGMGIPKLPSQGKLNLWDDVISAVTFLIQENHDRETLVLDTLNGAEEACRNHICKTRFGGNWMPAKGKEGFLQFGQGDKITAQEFTRLLNGLDILRTEKKMRIILLAHDGLHRCSNVFGEDFMKSGADMNKHTWNMTTRWADQVAHATKDVIAAIKKGDKMAKAKGDDARWLYFEGGPARDAKSRAGYEMPARIKLNAERYIAHENENKELQDG